VARAGERAPAGGGRVNTVTTVACAPCAAHIRMPAARASPLIRAGRQGEMDSLAQAREIYDELGAKRWLERLAEAGEDTP
jgi:hypothetical protein